MGVNASSIARSPEYAYEDRLINLFSNSSFYGRFVSASLKARMDMGMLLTYTESRLSQGSTYYGYMCNGEREGMGMCVYGNGDIYVGEWRNGSCHGWGVYLRDNGDSYEGNWSNNKRSGSGMLVQKNQPRYLGQFMNNHRHGSAVTVQSNGALYAEKWENDHCISKQLLFEQLYNYSLQQHHFQPQRTEVTPLIHNQNSSLSINTVLVSSSSSSHVKATQKKNSTSNNSRLSINLHRPRAINNNINNNKNNQSSIATTNSRCAAVANDGICHSLPPPSTSSLSCLSDLSSSHSLCENSPANINDNSHEANAATSAALPRLLLSSPNAANLDRDGERSPTLMLHAACNCGVANCLHSSSVVRFEPPIHANISKDDQPIFNSALGNANGNQVPLPTFADASSSFVSGKVCRSSNIHSSHRRNSAQTDNQPNNNIISHAANTNTCQFPSLSCQFASLALANDLPPMAIPPLPPPLHPRDPLTNSILRLLFEVFKPPQLLPALVSPPAKLQASIFDETRSLYSESSFHIASANGNNSSNVQLKDRAGNVSSSPPAGETATSNVAPSVSLEATLMLKRQRRLHRMSNINAIHDWAAQEVTLLFVSMGVLSAAHFANNQILSKDDPNLLGKYLCGLNFASICAHPDAYFKPPPHPVHNGVDNKNTFNNTNNNIGWIDFHELRLIETTARLFAKLKTRSEVRKASQYTLRGVASPSHSLSFHHQQQQQLSLHISPNSCSILHPLSSSLLCPPSVASPSTISFLSIPPPFNFDSSTDCLKLGAAIGNGGFGNVHAGLFRKGGAEGLAFGERPGLESNTDRTSGCNSMSSPISSASLNQGFQKVAVKVFKSKDGRQAERDFLAEFQILRQLQECPNIVRLRAASLHPSPMIVTDLSISGSLFDVLHTRKVKLTLPKTLAVAYDIANAVAFMHEHGWIHCDLKSANVLVDLTSPLPTSLQKRQQANNNLQKETKNRLLLSHKVSSVVAVSSQINSPKRMGEPSIIQTSTTATTAASNITINNNSSNHNNGVKYQALRETQPCSSGLPSSPSALNVLNSDNNNNNNNINMTKHGVSDSVILDRQKMLSKGFRRARDFLRNYTFPSSSSTLPANSENHAHESSLKFSQAALAAQVDHSLSSPDSEGLLAAGEETSVLEGDEDEDEEDNNGENVSYRASAFVCDFGLSTSIAPPALSTLSPVVLASNTRKNMHVSTLSFIAPLSTDLCQPALSRPVSCDNLRLLPQTSSTANHARAVSAASPSGRTIPPREENLGVVGTYSWMAPEVLRGEAYSPEADIYSLGLVLWELFSGKIPYANRSRGFIVAFVGFGGGGGFYEGPGELFDPSAAANSMRFASALNGISSVGVHRKVKSNSTSKLGGRGNESIPVEVQELIKRCTAWDARVRPSAEEIKDVLGSLYDECIQKVQVNLDEFLLG